MRLYLDPHGCAKNQVDAEQMLSSLLEEGWELCDDPETADLLIVNSCGFIESAKKESIEAVLGWRAAYPDKKIMLSGCLSQRYADALSQELAEVDFLFGNHDLTRVGEAARSAIDGSSRVFCPEPLRTSEVLVSAAESLAVPPDAAEAIASAAEAIASAALCSPRRPLLSLPGSAFLKISEGCDNRCSYCAIPLIRGGLVSRPREAILAEARALIARGVHELCLVGQDLAGYGTDRGESDGLCSLLESLLALEGAVWIRLLYIHPDHFPRALLGLMQKEARTPSGKPRLVPYFDIPFQHASSSILRAMGRKGDAASYLALVEEIRRALPDATIRSTFLLGFPGETGEDFNALLAFQQAARLDWLGAFSYSREEDTPAFNLKGRVPKKLADTRRKHIEEAQQAISFERMARFAGRRMDILIEEKVDGEEGLWLGRAPSQAPEVDGSTVVSSFKALVPGTLVPCLVHRVNGFDLDAVPLDSPGETGPVPERG